MSIHIFLSDFECGIFFCSEKLTKNNFNTSENNKRNAKTIECPEIQKGKKISCRNFQYKKRSKENVIGWSLQKKNYILPINEI